MTSSFILALAGGLLPALVWLLFWLREDWKHPEPNKLILKTFILGMLATALVIPVEKGVEIIFPAALALQVVIWAVLEECFKFCAGYIGGLRSVEDNEPVDPLVYMITAASGFMALENTLFILGPLLGHDFGQTLITGNMRFIGASLLHIVSSGIVGSFLAFAFYQSRIRRRAAAVTGLVWASLFHAAFNLLILYRDEQGLSTAFAAAWVGAVFLLWIFERAKALRPAQDGL